MVAPKANRSEPEYEPLFANASTEQPKTLGRSHEFAGSSIGLRRFFVILVVAWTAFAGLALMWSAFHRGQESITVFGWGYGALWLVGLGGITWATQRLNQRIGYAERNEQRIRAQGEFLRTTIDSLNHSFCVINADDHTVIMANRAATGGGDLSEGLKCFSLHRGLDRPCQSQGDACPLAEIKQTGKSVVLEHRYIGQDGQERVVQVHGHPIFDENRKVTQIIEYCLDITERKHAEEEIERIFNMTHHMICVVGADKYFKRINAAFEDVLGYSTEELLSRPYLDLVHPDDIERTKSIATEALETGAEVLEFENRYRCKDGTYRWLSWSAVPLAERGITYAIATDVTASKQVQIALQESEARFRTLVEHTPAITYSASLDATGTTEYISPQVKALLGFGPREFAQDPELWHKQLHPDDRAQVEEDQGRTCTTYEPFRCEYRMITKSGQVKWVHDEAEVIRDKEGTPLFMQGVMFDITVRKEAEELRIVKEKILECLNEESQLSQVIGGVLNIIKESTGFESVGLRLRQGDDYPYFCTDGFAQDFIDTENCLCAHDESGRIIRDIDGTAKLECMCGNIILGRTDPSLPFFTAKGSFWTNSTTELLAQTTDGDSLGGARNRCNQVGYESIALIPLRVGGHITGLLQLNSRRPGAITEQTIAFFEDVVIHIAVAIERAKVEKEIENLARFPDQNPNPVLRADKDGTILYANQAGGLLLDTWGCTAGERLPENWRRIVTEVLASGVGKEVEVDCNGRTFAVTAAPLSDAQAVNLYGHDITDRKRAAQAIRKVRDELEERVRDRTIELSRNIDALQRSEARLEEAQRLAHLGNWTWDVIANESWWSDEIYRIFGLTHEQFDGTFEAYLEYVHPDDRELVQTSVNAAIAHETRFNVDHRIVRPDGTERIIHEQAEIIYDGQGNASRMIGTVQDITERKRVEEELLRYQEQLQSLASQLTLAEERERRNIAEGLHDQIGQLLTGVNMKLEYLEGGPPPDDLTDAFEPVHELIQQAIEYTRTLTVELSPPRLYTLGFEAAVNWLAEQMDEQYGIRCDVQDDHNPKPMADEVKVLLYRIVRELLHNVVKHAAARRAKVSISRIGEKIRVCVEDDGVGFDPTRVKQDSHRDGFGLFSVRERLNYMKGNLVIRSNPGSGTQATVTVPLEPATAQQEGVRP